MSSIRLKAICLYFSDSLVCIPSLFYLPTHMLNSFSIYVYLIEVIILKNPWKIYILWKHIKCLLWLWLYTSLSFSLYIFWLSFWVYKIHEFLILWNGFIYFMISAFYTFYNFICKILLLLGIWYYSVFSILMYILF